MNNSLVVDILYPNKFSRWRNLEIKFFMDEFESDILVFRINKFAGINFNFDYEFNSSLIYLSISLGEKKTNFY